MEILTLIAIMAGPIAAVIITRHIDERRDQHARRMDVFRTLMRTRRAPMSADHVGALNLIEIEFPKDASVLSAWKKLLQHFGSEHPRRSDEQRLSDATIEENSKRDERFNKRLFDERQRLLAKTLHAMGKTLHFKVEQLEIFEGGYTPQGWQDELVEQRLIRRFFIDLYAGRAAFPVIDATNRHIPIDESPETDA